MKWYLGCGEEVSTCADFLRGFFVFRGMFRAQFAGGSQTRPYKT
jgi:hypothetical protein